VKNYKYLKFEKEEKIVYNISQELMCYEKN